MPRDGRAGVDGVPRPETIALADAAAILMLYNIAALSLYVEPASATGDGADKTQAAGGAFRAAVQLEKAAGASVTGGRVGPRRRTSEPSSGPDVAVDTSATPRRRARRQPVVRGNVFWVLFYGSELETNSSIGWEITTRTLRAWRGGQSRACCGCEWDRSRGRGHAAAPDPVGTYPLGGVQAYVDDPTRSEGRRRIETSCRETASSAARTGCSNCGFGAVKARGRPRSAFDELRSRRREGATAHRSAASVRSTSRLDPRFMPATSAGERHGQ